MKEYILIITAVLTAPSITCCSIKEDRQECPCQLTIILDKVPERIMNKTDGLWMNISTEGKGMAMDRPLTGSDYSEPEWFETDVQKGLVSVICSSNKALEVPYGSECDSIFAYSDKVRCYEDIARDTVLLKKQWCTATIVLEEAEASQSYFFEVTGKWTGMSGSGLEPIPGAFYAIPRRLSADTFQIRLPRQGDDTLDMTMNGLYKYALGKLLAGAGYDWSAPNLDDITIIINYARAEIQVTISPWEDGADLGDLEI